MYRIILFISITLLSYKQAYSQFQVNASAGVNYNYWKTGETKYLEPTGQPGWFVAITPSFNSGTISKTNFEFQFSSQSINFKDLRQTNGELIDQKATGNYLKFMPNFEFNLVKNLAIGFGPEISFLISENIHNQIIDGQLHEKPFFADFMLGVGGGLKYEINRFFILAKYSQTLSKETTFIVSDEQGNMLEKFISKTRNVQIGFGYRII